MRKEAGTPKLQVSPISIYLSIYLLTYGSWKLD